MTETPERAGEPATRHATTGDTVEPKQASEQTLRRTAWQPAAVATLDVLVGGGLWLVAGPVVGGTLLVAGVLVGVAWATHAV